MIYVNGRFRAFSNNINYKLYNFCIFCNICLCLEDIAGNLKNCLARYTLLVYDLEFTRPCCSATLSLLHLNQF